MSLILRIYRGLALLMFNTAFLLPAYLVGVIPFIKKETRGKMRARCTMYWARICRFLLGIRIAATGSIPEGTPFFLVSNHCSYLDIVVIGSLAPAVFISKDDVSSWPLMGSLARMAGTVFVDRNSKTASVSLMEAMKERLRDGVALVIFPEGTTSDGTHVMDFKSTFFHVPADMNIPVLPVSVRYTHINGIRLGATTRDAVAWYGDMALMPHVLNLLGFRSITARVHFSAPLHAAGQGRKLLAAHACACVREVHETLSAEPHA